MDPPTGPDPTALPELQAFLTRLARGLVRDEHLAEDLVQEAWVASLTAGGGQKAGWFARALRHLAINRREGERHRRDREARVARREAVGPTDVDTQLDHQTRVLEAVRRLPKPQRTVLFLRYYHDFGPTAIGRQLGEPVATVKARLARARELLRADLDRGLGGERGGWLHVVVPALLPTAPPVRPIGPGLLLETLAMSTALKTATVVLTLTAVGAGTWLLWPGTRDADPSSPAAPGVQASKPAADLATPGAAGNGPERSRLAPAAAAPPGASTPASGPPAEATETFGTGRSIRGRVLDPRGAPVPGVEVHLGPWKANLKKGPKKTAATRSSARGRADAAGAFELPAPAVTSRLGVDDPTWTTLYAALVMPDTEQELVLVAGRRETLTGTVTGVDGSPLAGAFAFFELPEGFRSRFSVVMDYAIEEGSKAAGDDAGTFVLEDLVRVDGAQVGFGCAGYSTRRIPVAEAYDGMRVVLEGAGEPGELLVGRVLGPDGGPMEGAWVSFGGSAATSGADGAFQLTRLDPGEAYADLRRTLGAESRTLRAVKPGFLPGELQVELDPGSGEALWPQPLVLQLGPPPGRITGRVVDGEGTAMAGVEVFLARATMFMREKSSVTVEGLLAGEGKRSASSGRTDDRGRFELGGLLSRPYQVVALDPVSGVHAISEELSPGGPELLLTLDLGNLWAPFGGQVVAPDGSPLAGAEIYTFFDGTDVTFQGAFIRTSNLMLTKTTADAEGRFAIERLPKEGVYLRVMGEDLVPAVFGRDEPLARRGRDAVDDARLVVARRAHLQVTLVDAAEADELALLDASGEELGLRIYRGKPGPERLRAEFFDGRTEVLSVSEAGRTLVFYLAGEEVRRRGVTLHTDRLNEVD